MTSCYQKFHIYLEIHSNSFCNACCLFQRFLRQKAGKPSPWKGPFASLPALTDKTSFLLYLKVYVLMRAHHLAVLCCAITQLSRLQKPFVRHLTRRVAPYGRQPGTAPSTSLWPSPGKERLE